MIRGGWRVLLAGTIVLVLAKCTGAANISSNVVRGASIARLSVTGTARLSPRVTEIAFEKNASRGKRITSSEAAQLQARARAHNIANNSTDGSSNTRTSGRVFGMVAEFDAMDGVLIRFPLGIPLELVVDFSAHFNVYILCQPELEEVARNLLAGAGAQLERVLFLDATTDSYWTRDYGPWWTISDVGRIADGIGDFVYDRPRQNDNGIGPQMAASFDVQYALSDLLLSGGNMMVDGLGFAAATDLIYEFNPTYTPGEIDLEFTRFWGVQMRAYRDPTGTYIEHIDCWAKFLDGTTMLVSRVPESHPLYQDYEDAAAHYEPWYDVVRVDVGAETEPYSNSLIVNDRVYVPTTGNEELDALALQTYARHMPSTSTIVGVPAAPAAPWEPTDALHCRTKGVPVGLPAQVLKSIAHPALSN